MHDAHSKTSSVSSVNKRTVHSTSAGKFSPSFGVRRGLIKDPNWPPAQFPEHGGTAASRRFRRVDTSFMVSARGEELNVKGDLSQGGAMFLLDRRLDVKSVDVVLHGMAARAEVLSCSKKGSLYAHHCRFTDSDESMPLWNAVARS
ncbi:MAG: PilZ domain-containing protein [Archangium sp.]